MVVMRHELPLRAPVERLDVAPVGDRGVLAVKRRARAGLRAKPEQVEERDLDHAAVSPLPRRSARAIRDWADDQAARGAVDWPSWER